MGAALFGVGVAYGHRVGGRVAHQKDFFATSGDGGVEEVALEHHEVRFKQRDDDDGVLAALGFMDADAVGEGEVAEVAAGEGVGLAVEIGSERAFASVDCGDGADVAVEEGFVVVVAQLDDFIAAAKFGAAPAQGFALRVERGLELGVEGGDASSAFVHGGQHLNVANGLRPAERARDVARAQV